MDRLSLNPVDAMLAQTTLATTLFGPTSRYYGIATNTLESVPGTPVVYLLRRLLPQVDGFQLLQEHTVTQGERLDNIAAHYFGDPELFWRLCDANNAMRPAALTATPGSKLRITLPAGITGAAL
jgi:hypothetical protein